MSIDAHKNFAISTVATAPSPATSGTSLVISASDGTKFPAASFNAVIWPTGANPTTGNAEIVRVTNISTDTFTITRAQESTGARTVVVGDQIMAAITAKTLTDVETADYLPGGTDVAVLDGGTGSSTASGARDNLGLGTSNTPQFTGIEVGAASDTTLARSSAGVISIEGVTVPLNSTTSIHTAQQIELGAASDTTITRTGAGDIAVEGNALYRAGGTDVPVLDGGTGSSTAAGAATNLGLGTGNTPQFTGIEVGAATDTTLARSAAGVLSVEGVNLVDVSSAQTETNKTLSDTFMGDDFIAQSGTARNITLDASKDFLVLESMQVGSGFSLELPATSTAEVAAYSNPNVAERLKNKTLVSPIIETYDGWIKDTTNTWSFASATSFIIGSATDLTTTFTKGTRIKVTNSTVKYFVVTSSSFSANITTVNITGGTTYTLVSGEMTPAFYSYDASPQGYPTTFAYTPTLVGFSADPTSAVYRFSVIGNECTCSMHQGANGTSNATNFTMTLPITAATITNQQWHTGGVQVVDNSAVPTTPGLCEIVSAGTTMALFKDAAGGAWTGSGGKRATGFRVTYEI